MDEALASNLKSQEYLKKVAQAEPSVLARYRLAIAEQDEGDMRTESGDVEKGAEIFERIRSDAESFVAAEPGNPTYQRFVQVELSFLAWAYDSLDSLSLEEHRKALEAQQARLEICRKMASQDHADRATQIDLAIAESETAIPLIALDPRKGAAIAQAGLDHFDSLLKTKPDDFYILPRRARTATRLAMAYLAAGQPDIAVARANEAGSQLRSMIAKNPKVDFLNRSAALAFAVAGESLAAAHRDAEAKQAFNEAAAVTERLQNTKGSPLSNTVSAEFAFDRIANYWKSRGDRAQARQWYERSIKIWDARPEKTKAVEARRKQAEQRVHEL
jgi:tetratricopeptide (TPR) repeat protein